MNRKLLWLLVISLAANLFLAAVAFSPLIHRRPPPPRPEQILEEMAETLPPEDAAILRATLDSHRSDFAVSGDDPQRQHEEIRKVLLTEPFDLEQFVRINDEMRARHDQRGAVIADVLIDTLPRISAEGRRRLANFRPPPR